ncbi:hypothetical protein ACIBLA_04100 [Streptomyces sp. NPDC050433]|uniref:hypothetical protein n=1 Tax=unclassified Streptomyces TaxID=2593676 RepID=UPI00341EAEAB
MPIDPFAVLNALLRAEAARSNEHETKSPTTAAAAAPAPGSTPSRTPETRREEPDGS